MNQRKKARLSSETASAPERARKNQVVVLAEIRLQTISVIFVGFVTLVLAVGAIAITLLAPAHSERV